MNIGCILFGILFIIGGNWFSMGNAYTHLRAWQEMPEKQRQSIRIRPLCRNIGGMIVLCGCIFVAGGIFRLCGRPSFLFLMVLWMISAGIDIWMIEKSGRYLMQ